MSLYRLQEWCLLISGCVRSFRHFDLSFFVCRSAQHVLRNVVFVVSVQLDYNLIIIMCISIVNAHDFQTISPEINRLLGKLQKESAQHIVFMLRTDLNLFPHKRALFYSSRYANNASVNCRRFSPTGRLAPSG